MYIFFFFVKNELMVKLDYKAWKYTRVFFLRGICLLVILKFHVFH